MERRGTTAAPAFEFGYEIKSKQVRRYTVNSLQSVRRAISSNIQDYLGYQGISENRVSLLSLVPNVFIIVAGIFVNLPLLFRHMERPNGQLYCVLFYLLYAAKSLWERHVSSANGSVIFESTGAVDVKPHSKPYVRALGETGKLFRISLDYTEKQNAVNVKMQLLEPPRGLYDRMRGKGKVLRGVERRICYCNYFSAQGFFYSVNMIRDVDEMCQRLVERYIA